jgi:hypothetical protein
MGASVAGLSDKAGAGRNEWRMRERYFAWAERNLITCAPSKFSSANRNCKDAPFETVNPIDDTVELPEPYYDRKLEKHMAPKNVYDKNVLSRRRFLYEIDGMALDDQKSLLEPLLKARVIQRVVYSGNKSLHCVIEEEDEPDASENDLMYKWVWRYMAFKYFKDYRFKDLSLPMKIDNGFQEVVDNRCGHPSRTTRAPYAVRKDEGTGGKSVEQKLLYFENVRAVSLWRNVWDNAYRQMRAREEAYRRRAQREAYRNRDQGKKVPNEAARRFMGGDSSDGWKHANLGSAVASLKACWYSRDEVAWIFRPYSKELQTFAMHAFDYFERRDRK